MKHSKTLFSGLVGLSLLTLVACTSANTVVGENEDTILTEKTEQKPTGYIKPGAAVEFSHNYDGKTQPGEVESFQVFVKGASLVGGVNLKVENDDGLQVYNDLTPQKLDIAEDAPDGLDHTMDMRISAQNPGRYYLKFIASSDQGDEPMMRSYGIAIQVGDQPYVPELGTGMTAQETPEGEKIITMEAKETIEN